MKAYIKSRQNSDRYYTMEAYDLRTGDAIGMQTTYTVDTGARARKEMQRDMMLQNIIPVSRCGKTLCYYDEDAPSCVAYLTAGRFV